MSKAHGEKDFVYRPHHIDDPTTFADNYDRIFKKGKYAAPTPNPEYENALPETLLIHPETIQNP